MKIIQAGYEPIHASVSINPSKTFQKWDGFGAMNLGANWGKAIDWSESETDTFMKDMGLNLMRIRIPYDENAWSGLVAGCKYAVDKYGAHILASPWTMPARMKTPEQLEASKNGITSSLKPECYAEYAAYLQKFVDYMKNAGAPIYAISIQNEPDWTATYEGCIWSAEQHLDFVKNYGDKIDGALLMTGESMGSKHSFYDPVLNDATACENIDIVGGHLYGVSPEPYSLAGQKGKSLWMTEHLLNESWTANTSHWYETLDMLKEIHNCLVNGWNAYIWWYGIRYYSLLGDGEKNTSRGAILPRGNAFAHYSSAIRPGDVRIECTSKDADGLLACAFKGENGRISVILLNSGNSRFSDLKLDFGQKFPEIKASCCSENGKQNVNVSIDGNIATLDLPGASVTSLVANP
ncbi:MAG: hypothetical protein K6F21_02975, partial [Bacteroidales bacterium]|nr:hypothetical protein [Bacteroidales bacterium]